MEDDLFKPEDVLIHYGVKGMKWGVRRDQKTLDRLAGRKARKERKQLTPQEREARNKKRTRQAAQAATAVAVVLANPKTRALITNGAKLLYSAAMKRAMQLNLDYLNKRYGQPKDIANALEAGMEFVNERFGSYNITSM